MQQLHKANCEQVWFIGSYIYCIVYVENESSKTESALEGPTYAAEPKIAEERTYYLKDPMHVSQNIAEAIKLQTYDFMATN